MRGISDTEVIGYGCDGEYTCVLHCPEPSQAELDDSYVNAVFAGDEQADEYHCQACYAAEHPKPTYLDSSRVTAVRETCIPCSGTTRTGYGPKLATGTMLQLDGKRWHRVYVMQWSNSGTAYVRIKGEQHLIATGELDAIVNRAGETQRIADYGRHLDALIAAKQG